MRHGVTPHEVYSREDCPSTDCFDGLIVPAVPSTVVEPIKEELLSSGDIKNINNCKYNEEPHLPEEDQSLQESSLLNNCPMTDHDKVNEKLFDARHEIFANTVQVC